MTFKRIAVVLCLIVIAGLYAGYRHKARQSMIDCTLEWGRLAPFPDSAKQFIISTEGSAFTRAFSASFTAAPDVIEKWISESPGFKDAKLENSESGRMKYIIKPGGGAQYAEVEIDDRTNQVKVYVYWS